MIAEPLLSKIHHPHVIMLMGASFNPLMIVTDIMEGDLEHLLLDHTIPLSLLTRLEMAKDAALGLNWLHCSSPMIIHRDVVRVVARPHPVVMLIASFARAENIKFFV